MSNSPEVQAARKRMQLARLEQKGKKKYPEFYANQPFQKERAKRNETFRVNKETLREANLALEIAEITGENLEEAKHNQAVAALVVERSHPGRRADEAGAGLTGVAS